MNMKKKIKNIIKYINKYMPLPINKRWIIFESHSDFCDSSRALFDYMYNNKLYEKYKFIWLVDEKYKFENIEYKNTKFVSLYSKNILEKIKLYWYCMFSKYRFYTHRPILFNNKSQITINLWHGTLLKSVKGHVPKGDKFDYILAPTEEYKEIYINQFQCKEEQLLYLGYPRNDMLFKRTKNIENILSNENEKFIIWMPTFRNHKQSKVCDSDIKMKYGVPIINTEEEIMEIDELLRNINTNLLIKIHPAQDISSLESIELSNIKIITNNILDKNNINLYSLIGQSVALITDYSSVYFDYLILDKQIGFITIDKDIYCKKRGYVFDNPLEMMPGMNINTIEQLKTFIENCIKDEDVYIRERERVNKIVNKYRDYDSSKRIIEYLRL